MNLQKRQLSSIGGMAVLGLVALFGSRAVTACRSSGAAGAPAAASGQAGAPGAASPDDALSAKLEHYIDCVNLMDPLVTESRDYYVKFLTADGQIDPKRTPIVHPLGSRLDKCYGGVGDGAKAMPKVADVEAGGAAYVDALRKLEPLLVDAERYYKQLDYKDDQFAKGNALHPQIIAGYKAFFAARTQLHEAIEKYNQEILDRALARIEKEEGKTLRYYTRRVMNDSSALLDQALDPATDPAKLRDAIGTYVAVYAEMIDRATKNPAEADRVRNFTSFVNEGDLMVRDFKELQRSIVAQLEKDPSKKPIEIEERAREELLKRYNELVEESNELEFKPAQ